MRTVRAPSGRERGWSSRSPTGSTARAPTQSRIAKVTAGASSRRLPARRLGKSAGGATRGRREPPRHGEHARRGSARRGVRALHRRDRRVVGGRPHVWRSLPRLVALRARRRRPPAEVDRRPRLRDRPRPALGSAGRLRLRVSRAGRRDGAVHRSRGALRAGGRRHACHARAPRLRSAARRPSRAGRPRQRGPAPALGSLLERTARAGEGVRGEQPAAPMSEFVSPRTFRFLRELAAHNERPWFEANKARYLADVRDPLLRFVAAVGPKLKAVSRQIVADPRPAGGSLFRIHRDVRFSKDKSPYKTHAAMSFRHADARERPAPGFYLHLAPGDVFAGAGLWHAEPEAVKQVRDAIVASPERWAKVVKACRLGEEEDTLKRAPRGYDPEHRFVADLRRQSFTTGLRFTQAQACAKDFPERFARACRKAEPLMAFLARAVGVAW